MDELFHYQSPSRNILIQQQLYQVHSRGLPAQVDLGIEVMGFLLELNVDDLLTCFAANIDVQHTHDGVIHL